MVMKFTKIGVVFLFAGDDGLRKLRKLRGSGYSRSGTIGLFI